MKISARKVGLSAVLLIGTSQIALAQAPACTEVSPSVFECEGKGFGLVDFKSKKIDLTVKSGADLYNRKGTTIGLGKRADVQIDGNVTSSNTGVEVGKNSSVTVGSEGVITAGNGGIPSSASVDLMGPPPSNGITVGNNSTVVVEGAVTSYGGSGVSAGKNADITVASGGSVEALPESQFLAPGMRRPAPYVGNGIEAKKNATITIEEGAEVKASQIQMGIPYAPEEMRRPRRPEGNGIKVKDNADIQVDGTVTAEGGGHGIDAGDNATIVVGSTGLVEATDGSMPVTYSAMPGRRPMSFSSGNGIDAGDDLTLVVEGAVSSDSGEGVDAGYDAEIFIAEGGEVTAGDDGIKVKEGALIINDGAIDAGDEGIESDGFLLAVNNGTITSVENGIESGIGNIILNNGTITSTGDELEDALSAEEMPKRPRSGGEYDAISLEGISLVGNFGTINSQDDAINIGFGGLVLNDGDINAADEGVEVGDLGFVLNTAGGSIDAGENGVEINSGFVYNAGSITGKDAAIRITGDPLEEFIIPLGEAAEEESLIPDPYAEFEELITVLGETGEAIFDKLEGIEIFGKGIGREINVEGMGLRGLPGAVILNKGTLEGEYGLFVEKTKRKKPKPKPKPGPETGDAEVLTSSTGIDVMGPRRGKSVIFINDGEVTGTGGTAVKFADGNDSFIWLDYSLVNGDVQMGRGYDGLYVLGAELLTETYFRSVEDVYIEEGVAAIFVPDEEPVLPVPVAEDLATGPDSLPGSVNGTLYTASGAMIGSGSVMINTLAEDIAERVLNLHRAGSGADIATQGVDGSGKKWWVFGGVTLQEDHGQGFTQESQNLTVGRNFGAVDLFFGVQNSKADMSATSEYVDQRMIYGGVTGRYDINENLELVGLAMAGKTDADYVSAGGTASGDGTFASVSGRLNYDMDGVVFGTYLGYARQKTDPIAAGALTFSTQTSDAVFGGIDVRAPSIAYGNGLEISPVVGAGFLNGNADGFTMSAGGISTTIAGSNDSQKFVTAGVDMSYGDWRGTMRVRADAGDYLTLDLGVQRRF